MAGGLSAGVRREFARLSDTGDVGISMAVQVDSSDEQKRAEEILKQSKARDISTTSEASVPKEKPVAPRM